MIRVVGNGSIKAHMDKCFRVEQCALRSLLLIVSAFIFQVENAFSATAANTLIQNRADVSYEVGVESFAQQSNIVSFRVDEIIDLTLSSNNGTSVQVRSPDTARALSFTLTNAGNGSESFSLQSAQSLSDDFNATNVKIYLDANANGIFEPLLDTLYTLGANDPQLNPLASLVVFVVSDIPASLPSNRNSDLDLTATSTTGSGTLGSSLGGAGTGGVNAVFGPSTGSVVSTGRYTTSSVSTSITKTQSILDPQNGSAAISNAVITYTLTVDVNGTGTLTNSVVQDLIPANTTYVANSLKLNNVALSDASDADAGAFNGSGILVDLGSVAAPATSVISFKVRIQ